MKPIQSRGGELFASSHANDTKLEIVREAIDSIYRNGNGNHPASFTNLNRRHRFAKFALLSIAAVCGSFLTNTSSAADSVNATAPPAATTAPVLPQKPAWLTDLSVGIKESYDDNIYLSGVVPTSATIPAGGVEALKNHSSWVTTVSPKVGFNFAPLLGDQTIFQALTFGYAPDFVTYHDAETESYNAHRIAAAVKGHVDAFSFNLDNGFNYINGSKFGPDYSAGLNAYGTGILRERREQFQDRSTVTFKYDWEKWFVRPTASLLYYDLDTAQLTAAAGGTGYQNYADRYDVNGGADVGYKLNKNLAVTLGYRYGHQYQQAYALAVDPYAQSSTSDYQRVLLGLEGKLFSWLDVKLQGGPDFRSYDNSAPVSDYHPTTYYGEAALTATLSKQDTLSFNYRQWRWVSSTGKVPYFDSLYDLNYKHKFNDKLSGNLEGRLLGSDYTSGLAAGAGSTPDHIVGNTNTRNDLFYTVSAGVQYAFNANFSANLAYAYDFGRNAQDGLTAATVQPREFDHQLVTLGVAFKF
jgi:opacity protein-like surface antigen